MRKNCVRKTERSQTKNVRFPWRSKSSFTVRLTLEMEGPRVKSTSTIGAWPAHEAKCNGLEPLSSALLQEAS